MPVWDLSHWQPMCSVSLGATQLLGMQYPLWIVVWEDECHLISSTTEKSTQQALAEEHVLLWKDARDSSGETKGVAVRKAKSMFCQQEEWTVKENKSQAAQDQMMTCHKTSQ